MGFISQTLLIFLVLIPSALCQVTEFVSIDCGGTGNYTDPRTGLSWISDTGLTSYGKSSVVRNSSGSSVQYQRRRDFPIDGKKYCYTLPTEERRRYIVRTTFLYGNLETEETYPKFELYLDSTKWTTVTIFDASRVYVEEMIIRAPAGSVDVCLCCATTGAPFISTLELRPLNLSMYATSFEDKFFLEVAARVNFGALTEEALRYPDDPYDRIWESDLAKRQNFLVGVAPGTERINTSQNIDVNTREYPPVKVMQTAVVGTKGLLTYRLNLEDFPANARAYAYFAEIEDLGLNETRKFILKDPALGDYNTAVVNIVENANGSYRLYEPSYMNVSLNFVLSFAFQKTLDSTQGPLLNAIEISRYAQIASKTDTEDLLAVDALHSMSSGFTDQGDPCLPVAWEWVTCSSMTPPRITKIFLSGRGIKGMIPSELNNLVQLTELWLDGNSFSSKLPDMSGLVNLQILHLENNQLTGPLPSYLGTLPSLSELNIENNSFTGKIPPALLSAKTKFRYGGNIGLHGHSGKKMRFRWILGASIGVLAILILLLLGSLLLLHYLRRRKSSQNSNGKGDSLRTSARTSTAYSVPRGGHLREEGTSHYMSLSDLESATDRFSKKIGKGSFGSVYYGRMKDGKEVAIKIMADLSSNGNQQFVTEGLSTVFSHDDGIELLENYSSYNVFLVDNGMTSTRKKLDYRVPWYARSLAREIVYLQRRLEESWWKSDIVETFDRIFLKFSLLYHKVALLSRIHHRNLVPLVGYCEEEHQCILIYEYMHNGTLRDHIHDSVKQKQLNWLTRLSIAEDAAKGLDYLHTGCNPSIIHRDVKTSNILLDMHMRAKVSDFGLSRQAEEDLTHVSSVARGTVGYLDPEYYGNQQLTEKSDVYSFGVVLLELISGRKPVSPEDYGSDWNMIHWARSLIRKGDVMSIVDPILTGSFKIESVWRVAEVALQCVEQHGVSRPRMQEIVLAIQEATKIEKDAENRLKLSPGSSKAQSSRKTLLTSFLEVESPDLSNGCIVPAAR